MAPMTCLTNSYFLPIANTMMLRLINVALFFFVGINAEHLRGIRGARYGERDGQNKLTRKLMMDNSERSKATGSEEGEPSVPVVTTLPSLPSVPATTTLPSAPLVPATTKAPDTGSVPATTKAPETTSVGGGNIRDDPIISPPLPSLPSVPAPTKAPVAVFGVAPTCRCTALCDNCNANGSNTASCRTVCGFAEDPNCVPKCNAALHLGS